MWNVSIGSFPPSLCSRFKQLVDMSNFAQNNDSEYGVVLSATEAAEPEAGSSAQVPHESTCHTYYIYYI